RAVKPALALVAAVLAAAPGASASRNPTPGAALVLQLPGMHRVEVRHARGLDVYRSPRARGRLPAVLVGAPRRSGRAVGWGQAIAASGMSAVVYSGGPRAAIAAVRSDAAKLGIDATRLCAVGFSSSAVAQLSVSGLRCNAVYYAPLDSVQARPRMTP